MEGHIYVILNKSNQKEYVGKTYKSINTRYKEHWNDSKKDSNSSRPLYRAFHKYGKDAFEISCLGKYPEGVLEKMEIKLIQERDTYKNGYNATLGGDGKRYFEYTDQEVLAIFKKTKDITKTARHFDCCRDTIRGILRSYGISGFANYKAFDGQFLPRPVETMIGKQKITFDSLSNAAEFIKHVNSKDMTINNIRKSISRAVYGERKSYIKLQWRLVEAC